MRIREAIKNNELTVIRDMMQQQSIDVNANIAPVCTWLLAYIMYIMYVYNCTYVCIIST